MSTATNWLRTLIAAVALAVLAPSAVADRTAPTSASARANATDPAEDRPPAGSPEFGLLIILGAVGFLIFVAWLFTRVGDDSPPSDKSMI